MNLKRIAFFALFLLTLCNVAFVAPWVAEACSCGGSGGCTGNCCSYDLSTGSCLCVDFGHPLCPREQ